MGLFELVQAAFVSSFYYGYDRVFVDSNSSNSYYNFLHLLGFYPYLKFFQNSLFIHNILVSILLRK